MSPQEVPLIEAIDKIRQTDDRYRREAYVFIVAALGVTARGLPTDRLNDPDRRHLSGQELLQGVVALARGEFGGLAPTVFREWAVTSGEDVGTIVFQLVQCGQLSALPQDSIEDFRGGPDLLTALENGFGRAAKPRPIQRPRPGGAAGGGPERTA